MSIITAFKAWRRDRQRNRAAATIMFPVPPPAGARVSIRVEYPETPMLIGTAKGVYAVCTACEGQGEVRCRDGIKLCDPCDGDGVVRA